MIELGTIRIKNETSIVEARNKIRLLTEDLRFDSITATRLATMTSELGRRMAAASQMSDIKVALDKRDGSYGLVLLFVSGQPLKTLDLNVLEAVFDDVGVAQTADGLEMIRTFKFLKDPEFEPTKAFIDKERRLVQRLTREELHHQLREYSENLEEQSAELVKVNIELQEDITERKQAEEALRESEEQYRTFFKYDLTGDYIATPEGQLIDCNPAFLGIFGLSSLEEAKSTGIESLYSTPADRQKVLAKIEQEKIIITNYEHEMRKVSGETIFISRNIVGEFDEHDKLIKIRGYLIDITERKQVEEEIRKLNEELEQRVKERTAKLDAVNKELEAFSYSVSHDLRAPLRAIDGFGQALIEDCGEQLDDEGKRLLGIIKENTRKMGQLIDDLLAFSRLGKKKIMHINIDMGSLAKTAHEELQNTVPERPQVKIKRLPSGHGDWPMMHQVWINLLSNAIKFTQTVDNPEIEIGGKAKGNENVYWIRDNGVGFDMKYADKLFDVFQRLHSTAEFEGTGIGLALVQRIIHRHGGRVWAEGEINKGATFYFTLLKKEGRDQ